MVIADDAAKPSEGRGPYVKETPKGRPAAPARRPRAFPFSLLGGKLREERLRSRMTLKDVANLSGVSTSQISDIEGGRKVTLESAYRVCGALQTRLSTIIRRVENASSDDDAEAVPTPMSTRKRAG